MNWDYVIVGAGSAGCALAHELVESGASVLVIEAGGRDWSPFIKVAAGQIRASVSHDWGYRSQPDPSRHGAVDNWKRGRVLGGSSSINGTMYTRGVPGDFDRWNLPGWSWRDVLPLFKALERSDQPGPLRGHGGQLHIRTVQRPHAVTKAFVASARAVGLPFKQDYNIEEQHGVAYAQLTQEGRFRCSAADAFIKPLLGKRNLKLVLNALVEKVEIVDGRAVAVAFMHEGRRERASARDVILCAGAVNSPKLLMLSGVGDPQELARHRIPLVLDLPAVGLNLKEQPLVRLLYRSRVPTYNLTEGLLQKIGIAANFLLSGEGPISNLFEAAAFIKSAASQPSADVQVIFTPVGYLKGADGRIKLAPHPSVTVLLMASYPRSRGRIRLRSVDPNEAPLIECPLLNDTADVDVLVGAIQEMRRVMRADPIASLLDVELLPGPGIDSRAAIEAFVREDAGLSYHPIGTCRMGIGDETVVGPDLRVRGTENLWIADASIIPDHLSANLNAPSIMVVSSSASSSWRNMGSRHGPTIQSLVRGRWGWTTWPARTVSRGVHHDFGSSE